MRKTIALVIGPRLYFSIHTSVVVDDDRWLLLGHVHGDDGSNGHDNDWGQSAIKDSFLHVFANMLLKAFFDLHVTPLVGD